MEITELLKISEGKWIKKTKKKDFQRIRIDSREINNNDAFLVIRRGYNYILEAIEKGASTIIIDRDIDIQKKVNIIKVTNCEELLPKLGNYIRKKYDPIVIGVTGSVGKTTTKEMIYDILSNDFNVIKNDGNENNHIGVPKTLLKIDETTNIVIVEIGMNHKDEIHNLSLIAKPDIAVITNIGTSHIGNFNSRQEIFEEKLKITDGMKDGILIINNDDKYLRRIDKQDVYLCKTGIHKDSDLVAYDVKDNNGKINSNIYIDNIKYGLKAISKAYLINELLALEIGLLFDLDTRNMIDTLNSFETKNNRLEEFRVGTSTIISDCYNASLESFYNVLEIIKKEQKEKILVLGDILELGKYSTKIHKKIGRKVRKIKNCELILIGEHVKYIKNYNKTRSIWCNTNEDIKECLSILDLQNKLIVIKGSHGMHLDEITEFLKSKRG